MLRISSKLFIGKDNANRYDNDSQLQDKWDNFELCNQVMIFNEFLGYKLFELACDVPKVYIGVKNGKVTKIYVQKIDGAMDFFQYIDSSLDRESIISKINAEKPSIIDKIQSLDTLGVLLFMGLWLNDPDTFGKFFSNILFLNNKMIKIDPAEMNLSSDASTFDFVIGWLKNGMLEKGIWAERYPMICLGNLC